MMSVNIQKCLWKCFLWKPIFDLFFLKKILKTTEVKKVGRSKSSDNTYSEIHSPHIQLEQMLSRSSVSFSTWFIGYCPNLAVAAKFILREWGIVVSYVHTSLSACKRSRRDFPSLLQEGWCSLRTPHFQCSHFRRLHSTLSWHGRVFT